MNPKLSAVLQERPELELAIEVSVSGQFCELFGRDGKLLRRYAVSTAAAGVNANEGSFGTPPGLHRIAERIGEGVDKGMCFVGRVPTGEMADIEGSPPDCRTEGDFILSRILWLEGLEPGLNHGEGIDSRQRYIYFHGTNEEYLIGKEASHGCIRMNNDDVIELFDQVVVGTPVYIAP
ncbi:L,D-transpeptidase [Pseudoteredinibacter isoporae]|uniref:L,D-transpeptidase n=1 Tax=Pseudoteredinibacter isoporae TaxID=570281 RepID=UPI003105DE05